MHPDRFLTIREEMYAAFDAEQLIMAKQLALEFLELAASNQDSWNYGNAIHHANLVLGSIALKSGHVEKAKEHLMHAGRTPGSPQLDSFGPNMRLAKSLLEIGEREVVLRYLEVVKNFWEKLLAWRKTRMWKRQIMEGRVPDFGAHLRY